VLFPLHGHGPILPPFLCRQSQLVVHSTTPVGGSRSSIRHVLRLGGFDFSTSSITLLFNPANSTSTPDFDHSL
jgi:hypothetical protein